MASVANCRQCGKPLDDHMDSNPYVCSACQRSATRPEEVDKGNRPIRTGMKPVVAALILLFLLFLVFVLPAAPKAGITLLGITVPTILLARAILGIWNKITK